MKLDTKLDIQCKLAIDLYLANIYRPQKQWRVFSNYQKARDWCAGRTNVGSSIVIGGQTECAAYDENKPETCAWRIEPLTIYY